MENEMKKWNISCENFTLWIFGCFPSNRIQIKFRIFEAQIHKKNIKKKDTKASTNGILKFLRAQVGQKCYILSKQFQLSGEVLPRSRLQPKQLQQKFINAQRHTEYSKHTKLANN